MIDINWENRSRMQLLQHLVDTNDYKKYLEIGCDRNQVFDVINVDVKEGVDPLRGGTIRKTSDDFFKDDNRKWDLIFIDGLHEYQQVTRDVNNSLERLNDNGTIVIHDMIPLLPEEAGPSPIIKRWLGDVWRLAFDLAERSDIRFNIFKFDCGCGIIRKGNQIPIIFNNKTSTWNFYENNYKKLPLITFNEYFNQ